MANKIILLGVCFMIIISVLFAFNIVSAFNFESNDASSSVSIYLGNLTNLSEMADVNIPTPSDNEVLTWDDTSSLWTAQTNNGNSSFNQSLTDSLYSALGYGDDWNKTYADILYAPINYGDDWNKTYADILYAPINYGDDWNKTYADTLYADISVVDTNTQLSEDDVEGYIFDNDNFVNLNLSGYNITSISCLTFTSGGKICSGS